WRHNPLPVPGAMTHMKTLRGCTVLATIFVLSSLIAGCKSTPNSNEPANTGTGPQDSELLDQADAFFRAKRYHRAITTYEQAAAQAARDGAPSVQVEAWAQLARCASIDLRTGLPASEVTDDSRRWFMKARDLASKDWPKAWSRLLFVRGLLEYQARMYSTAQATLKELFAYCEEKGLALRAIDAAYNLSWMSAVEDRPTWIERGIALAEHEKSDYWLSLLWQSAGEYHEVDAKDIKAALEAYGNARRYFKILGEPHDILMSDWAYGRALRLNGRCDEAGNLLLDARNAAETRFTEEEGDSFLEIAFISYEWGEYALTKGAQDQANEAFKRARQMIESVPPSEHWRRDEIAGAIDKRLANAQ
ncbi:MAG: hypothetical protein L6Q71_08485, partial [Planctomycetes bacterium]|nr:hypothetical protein [Planctomycetota bacterium]